MHKILNKLSMRTIFFIKSSLKNILLLILPLSIIVSYSLYCSNKETSKTIEVRNWNLMYQVKTQMDTLFHTVDTLGEILSNEPYISKAINQVFLCDDKTTIYNHEETKILTSYLKGIIGSNNYSHSAYLYFNNNFNRYIATSNGLTYVSNATNNDWLTEYENSSVDLWCNSKKITDYSTTPSKDVLAIYKKIYSPYLSIENRGVLVTYYSLESIQNYINNLGLYPGQIILFLQNDGTIFFQSSHEDFSDIGSYIFDKFDSLTDNTFSELLSDDSTYLIKKINYHEINYVASMISSSEDGFYYLSLTPRKYLYAQSRTIIFAFLIITVICVIIGAILGMFTAKQDYRQLQSILEIFSNASEYDSYPDTLKSSHKTDPYQVILNNIINLFMEHNYLQTQIQNKQYQLQLLELRSLQQQINPHFLFNTLNTIYWETIKFTNKPNTCSVMISDLTEILSFSFHNMQEKVLICKELEYLRHYTNIQSIRYLNKFEIIWDIDDDALNYSVIKMILQPLVENSIYHGCKNKETCSTIKIKVYCQEQYIFFSILDNGTGIEKEKLREIRKRLEENNETLEHIGLVNTNRRLILTYGKDSSLHIYSRPNKATIISFKIPLSVVETT